MTSSGVAHLRTPGKGEVVVFNRSYYEDVLVVGVHKLVPQSVWSKRYDRINNFESMLSQNGTAILKFYLHISPEEQLSRLKQPLEIRPANGRSAKATTPSVICGRNTWRLTRMRWRQRARSTHPGMLFHRITNGSAISRFR